MFRVKCERSLSLLNYTISASLKYTGSTSRRLSRDSNLLSVSPRAPATCDAVVYRQKNRIKLRYDLG